MFIKKQTIFQDPNELDRYMDPAFSDNRPEVRFTMVLDRDRVRVEAG